VQIPTVIGAVLIILGISVLYITLLTKMIESSTITTIQELAQHDQNSIENYITATWENLDYIQGRIASEDCQSLDQLAEELSTERRNSFFTRLCMVDADGKLYTDTAQIYDPATDQIATRLDLLSRFDDGADRIVFRFSQSATSIDVADMSLYYGIRLEDFSVDGVSMVALVGVRTLEDIQDKMVIDSFIKNGEALGYSAVIDMDGSYIVNVDRAIQRDQIESFFDRLNRANRSDLSQEELRSKMDAGEAFTFYYNNASGEERLIYMMPLTNLDIDWYFLLSVRQDALTDMSNRIILISMLMMGFIMLVIILLVLMLMQSRKNAALATAEAAARSEFLSNMSHEIRTPLNALLGLIHLAEKDLSEGNGQEQLHDRLAKTHATANYLLALVNDILDMSKLQAGKVDLNLTPVSPELIVDAVWSMQRSNIEDRGVEFVLQKDLVAPWVMGDETRLKQVLMNIVGNAAKFTPEGGRITLSVSQQKIDATHVTTTFVCADTGCGMSPEFLPQIWDSFTQERSKNSSSVKGTGLGLAISKRLMDAMGGDITVESVLDQGSTFTVTLPSQICAAPVTHPEVLPVSEQTPQRQHSKVLVVEDNELNAEILVDILTGEGFETAHAENGQQAVDLFRDSQIGEFDIILMDMQMPVMDGCTASSQIRKLDRPDAKTVTIFACTANTMKEDRARAAESGMDDFLSKPIDVDLLLQKLRQ
jgi:signal transduction histidine kinase/ActR/RegA family two-component response regulator